MLLWGKKRIILQNHTDFTLEIVTQGKTILIWIAKHHHIIFGIHLFFSIIEKHLFIK